MAELVGVEVTVDVGVVVAVDVGDVVAEVLTVDVGHFAGDDGGTSFSLRHNTCTQDGTACA